MPSCQCEGIELTFDEESIRKEVLFYTRDGADETTLWLIDAIESHDLRGFSLLDVGGGLGAIQHRLLEDGVERATHVDASRAYIEAAKQLARERALENRIEWRHGNFVELAPELPAADIVTLDRVVCCYDDMHSLVQASARLTQRYYGLVLPRDTWWLWLGHKVINFFHQLFRNPFLTFVHPIKEVEAILENHGLRKVFQRQNLMWRVALFER